MSFAFYALAFVAVANPFRWRLSLPEVEGRPASPALGLGVALLIAVSTVLAAAADPVLEWLDISPESWRIACGVVVIGAGLWVLAFPRRHQEPQLPGVWAGVVPVFFPILLAPELFVLLTSSGADESLGFTLGAVVFPVMVLAGLALLVRTPVSETVMTGLSRLLGALAVVVGLALIISGIRDV